MTNNEHAELNRCAVAYMAVFLERQEALRGVIEGADKFEADLGRPSVTFGDVELSIAMIGSSSSTDNTWMWGWANSSLPQAPGLNDPGLWLRGQAPNYNIPELAEPTFDISDLPDYGMGLGSTVAMAAVGLIGTRGLYAMPYAAGQIYVAIMDSKVELPQADAVTFPRRIGEGCMVAERDHRLITQTYCNVHQLQNRTNPDGSTDVAFANGSTCTVTFDENDRVTNIAGQLTGPAQ